MIETQELKILNIFDPTVEGYDGIFCGMSTTFVKNTRDLNVFDPSVEGYDGIFWAHSMQDLIIRSSFNTALV